MWCRTAAPDVCSIFLFLFSTRFFSSIFMLQNIPPFCSIFAWNILIFRWWLFWGGFFVFVLLIFIFFIQLNFFPKSKQRHTLHLMWYSNCIYFICVHLKTAAIDESVLLIASEKNTACPVFSCSNDRKMHFYKADKPKKKKRRDKHRMVFQHGVSTP